MFKKSLKKFKNAKALIATRIEKAKEKFKENLYEALVPASIKLLADAHQEGPRLIANDELYLQKVSMRAWEIVTPSVLIVFSPSPPKEWHAMMFKVRETLYVIDGDNAYIKPEIKEPAVVIKQVILTEGKKIIEAVMREIEKKRTIKSEATEDTPVNIEDDQIL